MILESSILGMSLLNATRPSALGMSDPVIESQELKETQEFPSIQNIEGGEEMMRNGERQQETMRRNGEKQ